MGYKVITVYNNSLAQQFGINPYDVIIAINRVKLTDFDKQFAYSKDTPTLELTIFRRERLMSLQVLMQGQNINSGEIYNLIINDMQRLEFFTQNLQKLEKWQTQEVDTGWNKRS